MSTDAQFAFDFTRAPAIPVSAPCPQLYPDDLGPAVVVAIDEPSLSVSFDQIRDYLRARMSPMQIIAEIESISQLASKREAFGEFSLLGLKTISMAYACIDSGTSTLTWMHEHERTRFNQLKVALPTPAEQAQEASERIKARIMARKNARQMSESFALAS